MPDSVIGQLAGKAFIIEPNGKIITAAEDSVLREGDILISSLFGHSDKGQKAVVVDIHQDRVLLQEQESLTELMIPDNLDVLDILAALEKGQDPTQLDGVEAAAGNAANSSSIAAQAIIESGSTSHVYAYAGFTTQTPTELGLTLQQLESIDRVFIAETENPIASLTGDSIIEEGTSASYTISISSPVDTDTRVNVVISHKTSESGDITPITREVIIPAGQTSTTFSVDIIDDVFDEGADSDTFTVSISSIQTGDADQNIATPPPIETNILDESALNHAENNDAPSLTLSGNETVIEGNSASYTLTLSHTPTSDVTITVDISRTTAEGNDVSESTREITIPAGSRSATFTIDTIDDVFDESNDNDVFSVEVLDVEGGGFERLPLLPDPIETIINDGDANSPSLILTGDTSINEGESANYTITLSEAPSSDMTVTVTIGHRTSEDGDVTPVTRDILIPAGSVSTTFAVDTANDVYDESSDGDVFSVTVEGVSGGGFEQKPELPPGFETTLNDGTADAPTLFLTGDSNVTEGGDASYTLTLSHAPSSDFTATIVIGHQTSESGDITPETRDIVIAAGTTSATFSVTTSDDVFDETNDTDVFNVSVSNTAGGGFEAQPTAPTSIETTIDEDTDSSDKPTLTLTGDSEVIEGAEASYTLTISEAPTTDLTVTVVVGHKTSEDGDVTPVTRNIVIAAGTTSTDFTVATLDDSILETNDDDVFEVSVTGSTGGGFEVLPDNPAAVETTINEDTTSTDKPTLTLTGDAEVVEGAEASYTLTISEAPTTDLTVTVVVGHKTSEDGDVTPVTRDVVIAAGTTSTDFTVATLDDSILETNDDDVFEVSVTDSTGGGFEVLPDNPAAVETTINEDSTSTDKPTLTLTGDSEVIEGAEASYTLTISEAPTSDLTITVVVGHKTSEDGDVTPVTRDVVIAAGTTSTDFTVATLDDSILETNDDDVFEVSVTGTSGGGFEVLPDNAAAVETTINEDATSTDKPTLTLTGDSEVVEGAEASYTLSISEAPTSDLTVTVVVGHKTSEDGDVTPVTRDVVISAGTTSTDFTVATLDDSILETNDDDVFEVSVTGSTGGGFEVLPDNPAAVETTINEDTTSTDKPTLTLTGDSEVVEGAEAKYTLTISEAPTTNLTVTVVVGHKTSEDGDVTPVTRNIVIAAGTTSTDFTVATLDDSILETNDDDVFEVSVTGTAGGGFEVLPDNPVAVETTINEDTTSTDKPTLTLTGDAEVIEGAEASYTLTISEAPTSDLTVTVVVGHKTSEDGDVTPVTRDVVIAAGTTSTDFTVTTLDDSILETNDDDVFEVSVTGTSGGGFEVLPDNPTAVETTINEDTTSTDKPTLTLTGDSEVVEGAEASYTLTISEAPTTDLTVTVVVGHKTSEDGDVTPVTRNVVIAAGTTSTDFTVATLDDSILETNDDDVFEVSVTGSTGGGFEVLPDNPAAVETTINEDATSTDKPTLTLTGDAEVTEGAEASYTLTISEAPTSDLALTVVVGHKTSEDGDVTPVTRDVVIAAGTTSTDFTVATLDDSILETNDDDVFEVSVTGSTGGGFEVLPDNPAAVETTINEDATSTDKPTLTLTGDAEVTEGAEASYTLTISEAPTSDLTITVVVGHKTSEDGDVTPVTRNVVIAAGTTSTDFTVATLDDSILETNDDDVFEVSVTGSAGGGFEVLPDNPAAVETTINEDA
ncbi:immunoglobulin-like domain-containing protein, partial [Enterovibrio baiacu]|uniref:immunoglobulin-like domain-containing protein n=1 Tax=Enterovibrio baiacu TaxID=2491023 RepID=UPI003D0C0A39